MSEEPTAAAPAPASAPASSTRLRNEIFVGGLAYSTRELALARHIEQVARVLDIHILMTYNNRSKGSAFVRLEDPSLIDEVCQKLNGKPLDGRYLEISRAKPFSEVPHRSGPRTSRQPRRFGDGSSRPPRPSFGSRRKREHNPDRTKSELTVAVLNLPWVVKEDDMNDIFEGYNIASSRICRTASGLSKGVGFVTFTTHEDQQRALREANKIIVENREVRVVEAFLLPEELEEETNSVEGAEKSKKTEKDDE